MMRISEPLCKLAKRKLITVVIKIGEEHDIGADVLDDCGDRINLVIIAAKITQQQTGAITAKRGCENGDAGGIGAGGTRRQT